MLVRDQDKQLFFLKMYLVIQLKNTLLCFLWIKMFNQLQVKQAVIWALQSGYRHIDCAPIYANEPEIGEAFQEMLGPDKVSKNK